jgi:hypothetical protein
VTIDELKLHVWRHLGLRRHLAGRQVVDDFVELAIQHWEPEPLSHCVDDQQRAIVCDSVLRSVKRGYQVVSGKEPHEYGIFWAIVLQAVASLVVQLILRWWLERRMNRVRMMVWQQELTR